jgi:cyclase
VVQVKKIIVALDVKDGRVVKSVKGVNFKDAGDPAEAAAHYSNAGADEIVLLDITATIEKRGLLLDLLRETAERVNVPLVAAGGIRSAEDAGAIFAAGAAKVSVGSAAVKRPALISELASKFGSEKIVAAVDVKRGDGGRDYVVIDGGHTITEVAAVEWAVECVKLGAGEILLTSFDADGTKAGYDLILTRTVADRVEIPVIASGGAGSLEDIYDGLTVGGAQSALIASLFHFEELTVRGVKEFLTDRGLEVDMSMYKGETL